MKVVRTIVALLIVLSVAVLPAAGGVALVAKSNAMSDMAAMADSDMAAMDELSTPGKSF